MVRSTENSEAIIPKAIIAGMMDSQLPNVLLSTSRAINLGISRTYRKWLAERAAGSLLITKPLFNEVYHQPDVQKGAENFLEDVMGNPFCYPAQILMDEGDYYQTAFEISGDSQFSEQALSAYRGAESMIGTYIERNFLTSFGEAYDKTFPHYFQGLANIKLDQACKARYYQEDPDFWVKTYPNHNIRVGFKQIRPLLHILSIGMGKVMITFSQERTNQLIHVLNQVFEEASKNSRNHWARVDQTVAEAYLLELLGKSGFEKSRDKYNRNQQRLMEHRESWVKTRAGVDFSELQLA